MGRIEKQLHTFLYKYNVTREICQWRSKVLEWKKIVYPIYKQKLKNPNAIFLVMTPSHGNLGDHMIAMSEIELLKRNKIEYIEITGDILTALRYSSSMNIMNGRLIIVNGGGNLGTLWFDVEKNFRMLIQSNPDSYIICMPNSIYYEDSEWGEFELQESIKVYNQHSKLKLYAREEKSYCLMKSIYRDVELVPDMAMALNYSNDTFERQGCIVCLRSDREKTLTETQELEIIQQLQKIFGKQIVRTDMLVGHSVSIDERNREVDKKIKEFQHAKLVVTDRLHAMVFCAISGTPCIVVNSLSPKVKGCYKWIQDLEYIKFAENICDVGKLYNGIPDKQFFYRNEKVQASFQNIENNIIEFSKRKIKERNTNEIT